MQKIATDETESLLGAFEAGAVDPSGFTHTDHLRVAFELLRRHSFTNAAERMATGLRRMLARVGDEKAYHETITVAYLSLMAERIDAGSGDFESFLASNRAFCSGDALSGIYSRERLSSALAKRTFILPDLPRPTERKETAVTDDIPSNE